MTTVKLDETLANTPAVHAFVIGVGDYPFLEAGSKQPKDKPTWGLGQLTSAPCSALEMAKWLATEFDLPAIGPHPARPLGSIELLVSQAGGNATFDVPDGGGAIAVDRADIAATKAAFSKWFDRAHSHEDNIALFFFSGHGFQGESHGLLLDGFSGADLNPFDQVIDVDELVDNMHACMARQQCFFIDACRNSPTGLRGARGNPLLVPQWDSPSDAARDAAFIRATSEHKTAFGIPGQPTRFTSALIRALRGAGCSLIDERWEVHTDSFVVHLNTLLEYESASKGLPAQRVNGPGDFSAGFALHVPRTPVVPVVIRCEPETDTVNATFSITRGANPVGNRAKAPDDWETELAIAEYEFIAHFEDGRKRERRLFARPALREVKL